MRITMIGSSFSIKPIHTVLDKDYIKSLHIYNSTTPVNIKTNSNEITYWLSHTNNKFQLYVFSLFIGKVNVGFAMTAYLKDLKILVIDYIAITEKYKNNTVFLSFFTLVQLYFNNIQLDINYFIVEISNKNSGTDVDKESIMFLKFLCLEDFKKIEMEYESLPLGLNNTESKFNAFLYLKSVDVQHALEKDTFIHFISALYLDYYLEWYKPFFTNSDYDEYNNGIKTALEQLSKTLGKCKSVPLSTSCCKEVKNQSGLYSNIDIPLTKPKSKKIVILLILLVLVLPVPIIWLYNYILGIIGIPINSVSSILGGVLGAIFAGLITLIVSRKRL